MWCCFGAKGALAPRCFSTLELNSYENATVVKSVDHAKDEENEYPFTRFLW